MDAETLHQRIDYWTDLYVKSVETGDCRTFGRWLIEEHLEPLQAELKKLDPDPVVCGCREALCPHTPIAKLPRQSLVDHYKTRIRKLTADLASAQELIAHAIGGDRKFESVQAQRDRLRNSLQEVLDEWGYLTHRPDREKVLRRAHEALKGSHEQPD